jgi:hypothetical protein
MTFNRRRTLVLLAAGVLPARLAVAQQQHHSAQANPGSYRPQFFSAEELTFLDQVTEMILPADDRSPGANAAGVANFIDLVVANSSPVVQQQWHAGIQSFGGAARFLALDTAGRSDVLQKAAEREDTPATEAGRFFVRLKGMTLHAYYTSEVGIRKELGYLGPEALSSFPGCKASR